MGSARGGTFRRQSKTFRAWWSYVRYGDAAQGCEIRNIIGQTTAKDEESSAGSLKGLASDESETMTEGRKDKRAHQTRLTEDASISQALLDLARECVEEMQKEVARLCDKLQRTSQEAKEKLQQEKPAGSARGRATSKC